MVASELSSSIKNNTETDKILSSFFFRWMLSKEIYSHFIDEMKLQLYAYYELDYVFFTIRSIMEISLTSIEQMSFKFGGSIFKEKEYLNSELRAKFTKTERLIFDELALIQASKLVYSALTLIMLAMKESNNIKFFDSRKKERARCNNRYKNLEFLSYVIKLDSEAYDSFKKSVNSEVGKGKQKKIEAAEIILKKAENVLKDQKNIEMKLRNECYYDNEFINSMMKAIISNKLFITKFKKLEEGDKKTLKYEFKYEGLIPTIGFIE